jgi:cytoskeletal protein RodZ
MTERQLNCADIEPLLDAFHDGELGDGEKNAVGEHLAVCADCQERLGSIARLVKSLGALPTLKPARDLAALFPDQPEAQPDKLAAVNSKRPVGLGLTGRTAVGLAAALLLLFLVYAGYQESTIPKLSSAPAGTPNSPERAPELTPGLNPAATGKELVMPATKATASDTPALVVHRPEQATEPAVLEAPHKQVERQTIDPDRMVAFESTSKDMSAPGVAQQVEFSEQETVAVANLDEVGRTNTASTIGLATDEDGLYAIEL